MPSGGLLRDPGRIWHDVDFQRSVVIQASILSLILILSAFYHYVVRQPRYSLVNGVQDEDIAEIDSLIVYPLKSGRGIELSDAEVSRKGFKYDRRWAIVRKDGLKRLNLKDEPRLTHIVPSFDGDILALRLGDDCPVKLPKIGIPLEADEKTLASWPLVQDIAFYGDSASGREVQLVKERTWKWDRTPSEWVSEMLGYPVYFLQFDPSKSKRDAFPLFRPPHDLQNWDSERQDELKGLTKIEFQDLYPFLIATRESLAVVNEHVKTAVDTGSMKMDKSFWSKQSEISLPIQRFRPNIVLRSRRNDDGTPATSPRYQGFSEDSWETIWVDTKSGQLPIQLVARCERCLLTTVDPVTAHRDVNIPLAHLRHHRLRHAQPGIKKRGGPCFGMYSIPEQIQHQTYTTIRVGDAVRVRWRPFDLDDEVKLGHRVRDV
jgi:hypothetical protein